MELRELGTITVHRERPDRYVAVFPDRSHYVGGNEPEVALAIKRWCERTFAAYPLDICLLDVNWVL